MTFFETVTAAVNDMMLHGYNDMQRVVDWAEQIRAAAKQDLVPLWMVEASLTKTFRGIYKSKVETGALLRQHKGIPRYTLAQVMPHLRQELDRRILAAADLVKLNREAAIQDTIDRFVGFASSIPPRGTRAGDKRKASLQIRKELASLPFRERRVAVDQAHKFTANLSDIVATDGGAIAGIWHSHWRQRNYKFRVDHKERDQRLYVIRNNWAMQKGLMKLAGHEYSDQITAAGEEVFCRCFYQYIYNLRSLPPDMVTEKGAAELLRVRNAMAG